MKMLSVRLTKKWSGHEAGETVTVEDYTAESMVRKGYGDLVKAAPRERPKAETTMATPPAETADNPPAPEAVAPPDGSTTTDDSDAASAAGKSGRGGRKRKDGD